MDNRVLGGLLLLAGAGALGYVYWRRGQLGPSGLGSNITAVLQPGPPLPSGRHDQIVTLHWVSTGSGPITVQGITLQGGVVTGHWFVAPEIARQAVALYDAGNLQQAAQIAATDSYRRVAVPAGGTSAILYETLDTQPAEEWWFYLQAAGKAMIVDPVGAPGSRLPIPDFRVILPGAGQVN